MRRRDFIKKTGLAAAGAFAVPYILPSGSLFAASGVRRVNHVVFCLYAGGVRNIDTVQKGLDLGGSVVSGVGNLLPNMLKGTEAIPGDIAAVLDPLPGAPLGAPLQTYGTLFRRFRYADGPTGHFNGHTTAVTGAYTTADLNIKQHPDTPTIFELYRKHNSPSQSAMKCWWVSNTLGPYPVLNFSNHADYGAAYGANFIAPTSLISQQGYDSLGNMKNFSSSEEAAVHNIRNLLNNNFGRTFASGDAGVMNGPADVVNLQTWITDIMNKAVAGTILNPWGVPKNSRGGDMSGDMYNIFFAEELIAKYKPEMLVVNMQDVDVCHSNFPQYCNNLRKADYAVAHLWKTIQNTPGMMNDTVMIVAPEHGRNLNGNSTIVNGRAAIDHTAALDGKSGDQTARDIFCLILGPPSVVKQNQVIDLDSNSNPIGESIEIASAMANMLGFDSWIPPGTLRNFSMCGINAAFQ